MLSTGGGSNKFHWRRQQQGICGQAMTPPTPHTHRKNTLYPGAQELNPPTQYQWPQHETGPPLGRGPSMEAACPGTSIHTGCKRTRSLTWPLFGALFGPLWVLQLLDWPGNGS